MNLNTLYTYPLGKKRVSKIALIMRLTAFILFVSFMQVSAAGFSQTISLNKKNIPLTEVFKEIRKQTGYDFVFTQRQMEHAHPVSVQANETPLVEVLAKCFETQPFSYFIQNNTIIVMAKREEKPKAVEKQQQSVSGIVRDAQGNPVSGVSIAVKAAGDRGTRTTLTDDEGRFIIPATSGEVLVFTSVGFRAQEIKIGNESVIQVQMQTEVSSIDDVVVMGYGTLQRKDLTGSVASVNVNEIKNVPFATIDQALTGKAAGVQVVQSDGSPGGVAKIRIRGGTSLLGGNDPLYIVDGVQIQIQNRYQESSADIVSPTERVGNDDPNNTIEGSFARGLNSLGGLNFNDIESIDILKDASATAIYGSRAANGVVIITTRKGKHNQKPVFDANYYTGMSTPIKEQLLNAEQYIMIMKEAAQNLNDARASLGMSPDARASSILNDPEYMGTSNTDWLDLVLRDAITQNGDISVRGGGNGSRYYTSLGFNKNNGVVEGTDYSRIAGKVSLDNDITSRLRVNTNLNYGFTTNNITNGLYTQALFAPPTFDPYNADGSVRIIAPEELGAYAYQGFQNPLALLSGVNKSTNASLIGSLAAEFDLMKDLTLRSSFAINYNSYQQDNYVPSTASIAVSSGMGSSNNGMATRSSSQDVNSFFENTLTWNKTFNEDHRLNLLVGTSWQITRTNFFTAKGQGFPDDQYLNNLSSAAVTLPSEGGSGQNSLLSFYLRANYTLMDKYIFTFTGRSDESSKFPKGNRIGYFPSGGVAWRISEENFLKDVSWLDELKLRASMGYTGTQNIADNLFYTLYDPISYAGRNGLTPSQLGNDRIRWESTLQKDAGINFSIFDGRLSGEFGYYEKSTTGVLFPTTVASSSGFTQVTANIANVRNRGLELALSADFIRKRDFQWSGTFNISGNRSKVLALSDQVTDPDNPEMYRYGNTVLKVGEPLGLLYGRVFDGLLRTQEEVDAYREQNLLAYYGFYPYLGIGDARYVLDAPTMGYYADDVIGNAEPNYYGGYTNNLNYKNFGLSFLATFSKGGDILYLYDAHNQDVSTTTNKSIRILDRWTPENQDTERPRLVLGESAYAYTASNNVYDASFLRLKSVTFSYQLPGKLKDKWGINNAMAYLSATNLFTITGYPGGDPEVSNDPYSLIGGYSDVGGYPTVRQFSLGFRVGF